MGRLCLRAGIICGGHGVGFHMSGVWTRGDKANPPSVHQFMARGAASTLLSSAIQANSKRVPSAFHALTDRMLMMRKTPEQYC